jgi:hypothetical protein
MTRYRMTTKGEIPFTPEEEMERDAEEAAWVASANDRAAAEVRAQRNSLLAASDWTQVDDAPVDKAAWATYRQELRDISAQEGFPWAVEWPTQPE